MAILPIRTFGDPVLKEKARPVEAFDEALQRLAADMIETMQEAPGVGLAAPQVGRSIRLLVYDVGDGGHALINPTLYNEWGEQIGEEGCLSLPGLYYPLRRFAHVVAEGYDARGNAVTTPAEDLLARVLQHEVDHLDGVLFVDRLEGKERRQALAQLRDQALGLADERHDPARAL
ncbi:MAG TPA: peptide deformylase [Actinomycetota bacterium]|nr:peptide deformylase [Actinomycetota bacterium]